MGFYDKFQESTRSRCEVWHPGGITEWDLSDWTNAAVGEYFEWVIARRDMETDKDIYEASMEAVDVASYLFALASFLRASVASTFALGASIDEIDVLVRPHGAEKAELDIEVYMESLTSNVKEYCRNRDSLSGKGFKDYVLFREIEVSITNIILALREWVEYHENDFQQLMIEKFNIVSDRYGFERIDYVD